MADRDTQQTQERTPVRALDAAANLETAGAVRRTGRMLGSTVAVGAAAAAVVGGGIAGVDGLVQLVNAYPHLAANAAPFLGAGVGGAAITAIPEMSTRLSTAGAFHRNSKSYEFRALLRRVKVRATAAAAGLGLTAAGLSQIHMAGMGGGAEALGIAAAVAAGVATTSAAGQRIVRQAARENAPAHIPSIGE